MVMYRTRRNYKSIKEALDGGSRVDPLQMIITGEGGTGKSWLIRHIVQDTRYVFSDFARRVLLMAHQGAAAYNIGGRTICASLALGSVKGMGYNSPYKPLSSTKSGLQKLRQLQDDYRDVHLVVVDEFSVISCAMLYWIDQRLREIFPDRRYEPFGGRDIMFVGDPAQPDPVTPFSLSTPLSGLSNSNQREGRALWTSIRCVCRLTSQNRGRTDVDWFDSLRRLREMHWHDADIALFNSRLEHKEDWPTWTQHVLYITYRNEDVDEANRICLQRQNNPIVDIEAAHSIRPSREHDSEYISAVAVEQLLQAVTESKRSRDREVPSQPASRLEPRLY